MLCLDIPYRASRKGKQRVRSGTLEGIELIARLDISKFWLDDVKLLLKGLPPRPSSLGYVHWVATFTLFARTYHSRRLA
jgi:hypothetical protein